MSHGAVAAAAVRAAPSTSIVSVAAGDRRRRSVRASRGRRPGGRTGAPSSVTSPPVTAAATTNVPASMRSGMTACSAPRRRRGPRPRWCPAPSARPRRPSPARNAMRSSTSGSWAAGRIVVVPSARVAARIAFSVPMTRDEREGHLAAAQPAGRAREVVAVAVVDVGAQGAHRLDVQVDRPPADPVAAGVADDDPPEARQQRAQQDEAGAHLGRRLERHEQPVHVARGDLVDVRAPGWSTTTPRSRRVSAMTRTSSISGTLVNRQRSPVSVAAASSLSAAFLAPLIRHRAAERPAALDAEGLPRSRARAGTPSGTVWRRPRAYPRCRGPSRWRRSATRMRRSARCSWARARGQVGGSSRRPRGPVRPRGGPPGPSRGRSRRPGRPSRP